MRDSEPHPLLRQPIYIDLVGLDEFPKPTFTVRPRRDILKTSYGEKRQEILYFASW